jgi:transposase
MKKSKKKKQPLFKKLYSNAAGIDIGAESHYVAVPAGRDQQGEDVRRFGTFTSDLHALANWLEQCKVDTIAMESTGVYWIPIFEILESKGFDVKLVNPRSIKNVPGRKTDVVDCQWIQQLHSYGLLQGSFRPDDQICILRSYLRQRSMLISDASQYIQRMQKALEQMNIKLNRVIRDITGVTGMAIIGAILDGERNAKKLAQLRNSRCKNDAATIAKSLHGNWRQEHLFALEQSVDLFNFYQKQIALCDRKIEKHLSTFDDKSDGDPLDKSPKSTGRNKLLFDARDTLYQMTGIDLTRVDGLDTLTVLKIVSEIGLDMNRWPTEKHFASWLGLCPGSKISGGKVLSARTKKCSSRAAHYLRLAAYSLHRSDSAIGAFFRRKKSQLGPAKAITATAHKLARIIYNMLKNGTEYKDLGQDYYESQHRKRVIDNLKRRAKQFGCQLVIIKEQQAVIQAAAG